MVVRAAFANDSFSSTREQTAARLDSVAAYFNSQFPIGTRFFFELAPDMNLPEFMSWYGANRSDRIDALSFKAVMEACTASDASVDFRHFDSDSDGNVDCVIVIFSGKGEDNGGGEDSIWPRFGRLSDVGYALRLDGRDIDAYCVMCEDAGVGTICHEFAHSLGLPDFYDTDGELSGGTARAMWGSLSLMDGGRHNGGGCTPPCLNAVERMLLGIGTPTELSEGSMTLQPIERSGQYFRSGSDDEFILLECRADCGLLAYRIDRSFKPAGWSDYYKRELSAAERWKCNQINCRPDRQCAAIIPARENAQDLDELFFPQDGIDTFSPQESDFSLTGIRRLADGAVSFEVIKPIHILEILTYQDAATIRWSIAPLIHGIQKCEISWWKDGHEEDAISCRARFSGCHTIEGLQSGTDYIMKVEVTGLDGNTFLCRQAFRTRSMTDGTVPYILLNTAERNADGSFRAGSRLPLRMCGTEGVAKVEWYLGDDAIETGSDGMWTVSGSGTLKAVVWWEDGGKDIFVKEITVR